MPPHPAPPAEPPREQFVTSSELVRHFGLWQERAARAPLYILHRGRPRFVLTSVETMDALCGPYAFPPSTDQAAPTDHTARAVPIDAITLLDSISDLVLVADGNGTILATSRAARAHFGQIAAIAAPVAAIAPAAARAVLVEAIARVIAAGQRERLEIASAARAGRSLLLTIEPAGAGIAVIARDGTAERDQARATAIERALGTALHDATGVASAIITLRGYVVDPTPALAALTGLDPAALAHVRFVDLVDTQTRPRLEAAMEAAIDGGTPPALDLALPVVGAEPIAVRIGLAPVRCGGAIDGVAAAIVVR